MFFYANLGLFPPIASTLNQVLVLIGTRKKLASAFTLFAFVKPERSPGRVVSPGQRGNDLGT